MRRNRSGAGCGACGCVSHTQTREALGFRPAPLRGTATEVGWTGTGERREIAVLRQPRLPPSPRKRGPGLKIAAVARLMALRETFRWFAASKADRDQTTLAPVGRAAAPRSRALLVED